jgi:hypothetical protein
MKTSLNIKRIARDSVLRYFAPLTGAYKGIREEYRRLDAEANRAREVEAEIGRSAGSGARSRPGRRVR